MSGLAYLAGQVVKASLRRRSAGSPLRRRQTKFRTCLARPFQNAKAKRFSQRAMIGSDRYLHLGLRFRVVQPHSVKELERWR